MAPAPAPITPPITAPATRFFLLTTAPVPAPTTPPMTAPLAVLLQPFFDFAVFPDSEDIASEPPDDPGLVFVEDFFFSAIVEDFSSGSSCVFPSSFCAFQAWYSDKPDVSVAKRSESLIERLLTSAVFG